MIYLKINSKFEFFIPKQLTCRRAPYVQLGLLYYKTRKDLVTKWFYNYLIPHFSKNYMLKSTICATWLILKKSRSYLVTKWFYILTPDCSKHLKSVTWYKSIAHNACPYFVSKDLIWRNVVSCLFGACFKKV